jgi:hypothetical protein
VNADKVFVKTPDAPKKLLDDDGNEIEVDPEELKKMM